MYIDHIAMYVRDLEAARRFFAEYFGASSNGGYHNPSTGLRTYFLSFTDGARLEIMSRPDTADAGPSLVRQGYIHLAFHLKSREEVDALTNRLRSDGYQIVSGPRTTGDGYYESCVLGPEGNQIEITC